MVKLLFSAQGRLGRGNFWKGVLLLVGVAIVMMGLAAMLGAQVSAGADGGFNFAFDSTKSLPAALLTLAYVVVATWAGVCLGIKRYHDRDKSGTWLLIQFVPFIGAIWYFVEAGFLPGTPGPNRFGPARNGAPRAGAVAAI